MLLTSRMSRPAIVPLEIAQPSNQPPSRVSGRLYCPFRDQPALPRLSILRSPQFLLCLQSQPPLCQTYNLKARPSSTKMPAAIGGLTLSRRQLTFTIACLIGATLNVQTASIQAQAQDLSKQLDAIFNQHVYEGKFVQLAWQNDGDAYTILEPAANGKGTDIVAYDTASGTRSVLIPASQLIPTGAQSPIEIEAYSWSEDKKKLLIFTNSKKVWRRNTRGDYWVFDTTSIKPEERLIKLGGDAPESSLMFATLSPDGSRVAYVRANNL